VSQAFDYLATDILDRRKLDDTGAAARTHRGSKVLKLNDAGSDAKKTSCAC
jgi:hypothetical protein